MLFSTSLLEERKAMYCSHGLYFAKQAPRRLLWLGGESSNRKFGKGNGRHQSRSHRYQSRRRVQQVLAKTFCSFGRSHPSICWAWVHAFHRTGSVAWMREPSVASLRIGARLRSKKGRSRLLSLLAKGNGVDGAFGIVNNQCYILEAGEAQEAMKRKKHCLGQRASGLWKVRSERLLSITCIFSLRSWTELETLVDDHMCFGSKTGEPGRARCHDQLNRIL